MIKWLILRQGKSTMLLKNWMMLSLYKWNQREIYLEILVVKFWIILKLMEILTQDFGIIYGTYMTEHNFILVPSPSLVSFSWFSFLWVSITFLFSQSKWLFNGNREIRRKSWMPNFSYGIIHALYVYYDFGMIFRKIIYLAIITYVSLCLMYDFVLMNSMIWFGFKHWFELVFMIDLSPRWLILDEIDLC
jgi:hypothetical protein